MKRAFTLFAGVGILSVVLAQEVTVSDTRSREVDVDAEQDVKVTNSHQDDETESSNVSHEDDRDFKTKKTYELEKDYQQEVQKLASGEEKRSFNKGTGRNFRKEGVKSFKEDCGAKKLVEKSGNVKHFKNNEHNCEFVVEVEHQQHRRHNKDAHSKKNKWIKKRGDRKAFNLNHGSGCGEKVVFKRGNNKSKYDLDKDVVGEGEKCGSEHQHSFVKVNKHGREVDVDVKKTRGYEVDKNKKVTINKNHADKEKDTQTYEVNKETDYDRTHTDTNVNRRAVEQDDD